jgi:hypothetical protein
MMTTAAASRLPCGGGPTEWRLQPAEFFAATDVLLSPLKSSALNFSQHARAMEHACHAVLPDYFIIGC